MPCAANSGAAFPVAGLRANAFRMPVMITYPETTPSATATEIVKIRTNPITSSFT